MKTKVIGFFVRVALFLALLVSVGQFSKVTVYASWTDYNFEVFLTDIYVRKHVE